MARFDAYSNPFAPMRGHTPKVLDVQNDHLGPLASRVVMPLRMAKGFGVLAQGLNPAFQIDGKSVVLNTAALAPVPSALLKKPVQNMGASRDAVQDALDTPLKAY